MAETPKIQIDSDWKAQAQAEKQKLAEKAKTAAPAKGAAGAGGQGGVPQASIEVLINTLTTQAAFYMGLIPDPRTQQRVQHPELARHQIDMLTVLEEKTKGNLTEEEANLLANAAYELRNRYIQMVNAARGG